MFGIAYTGAASFEDTDNEQNTDIPNWQILGRGAPVQLNREQTQVFWDIYYGERDHRKMMRALALLGCAVFVYLLDVWYPVSAFFLVLAVVALSAGTASVKQEPDESDQPSLEVFDKDYRVKAVGQGPIDAAVYILLIRGQETRKSRNQSIRFGVGFGIAAILCGVIWPDRIAPCVIGLVLAVLFIAHALKVHLRLKVLGADLTVGHDKDRETDR